MITAPTATITATTTSTTTTTTTTGIDATITNANTTNASVKEINNVVYNDVNTRIIGTRKTNITACSHQPRAIVTLD